MNKFLSGLQQMSPDSDVNPPRQAILSWRWNMKKIKTQKFWPLKQSLQCLHSMMFQEEGDSAMDDLFMWAEVFLTYHSMYLHHTFFWGKIAAHEHCHILTNPKKHHPKIWAQTNKLLEGPPCQPKDDLTFHTRNIQYFWLTCFCSIFVLPCYLSQ